jgi:hypothetical protein
LEEAIMLRAGDQIDNARTGQRKTFLVTAEDSGGELRKNFAARPGSYANGCLFTCEIPCFERTPK